MLQDKSARRMAVLFACAFFMTPAFAHPEGSHAFGFTAGFVHPLSGLDHLLAMMAVGIWAAWQRRAAVWVLPLVFPSAMALGALAGMTGIALPGVETGIAGSVAVLGLLIAFAIRMPIWCAAAVVSLFAVAHGYAHGIELPRGTSPMLYGLGFVAATILLHLAGIAIGSVAREKIAQKTVRVTGAVIATVGAYMLTAAA